MSVPLVARVTSPLRSPAFLLVVALANVGGVIAYLPLLALLLPLKIEALSGPARIGVFTTCVVVGGITASLSNILFGWWSDRSLHAGIGRRRWIAGALAALALSYVGIAAAASAAAIVIAVVMCQIAINAVLAPTMAIIAEEIPDAQKGTVGGLLSLASPIASALTAAIVAPAMLPPAARFMLVPVAATACLLPLLMRSGAAGPVPEEPPAPTQRLSRRDLVIAGVSRLLVQVAGVVTTSYLLYYFESITRTDQHGGLPPRIGQLLTIAFILPLPVAVLLGRLSDVSQRRKPFLLLSSTVAAGGLVGMGFAHDWASGAACFTVYTIGSSVFIALHAAFAMQLLPSPRHRGRDLGLLNLANTLPALLGPPLTWLLATAHDFSAVMLMLAPLTLCGGIGMLGVKAWR